MDAGFVTEWLNLTLRWDHMIVGIAWVGASSYFIRLAGRLPPDMPLSRSRHTRQENDGMSSSLVAALLMLMNASRADAQVPAFAQVPPSPPAILKREFRAVGIGHAGNVTVELFGGQVAPSF